MVIEQRQQKAAYLLAMLFIAIGTFSTTSTPAQSRTIEERFAFGCALAPGLKGVKGKAATKDDARHIAEAGKGTGFSGRRGLACHSSRSRDMFQNIDCKNSRKIVGRANKARPASCL